MTICYNFRDVDDCGDCVHCRVEQSGEWLELLCIKHDLVLNFPTYTVCDDYDKKKV